MLSEGLRKIGDKNCQSHLTNPLFKNTFKKFTNVLNQLESTGPTSQLWLLYFKLICLMQRYTDAERFGNFHLHLQSVISMTLIFFASGHHLYTKACLL